MEASFYVDLPTVHRHIPSYPAANVIRLPGAVRAPHCPPRHLSSGLACQRVRP